ncbi:MAG: BTAD domain-containing putative transcriptional regulator [Gemmatimonadota bacterium]
MKLFGSPEIEVRDGDSGVPARARQRHRIALLALLAVETRGLSRDKLIGYLWPESDEKQARNLLSVSLYVLRGAFGEEALLSRADDVRLDLDLVRADVVDFEAAMDRGDHEAAVALYEGPFLDGFFLPDAGEFERWADRQRERLARRYADALEELASRAEESGDVRPAVEWWRRRLAHDRFDARVTVRLMRALAMAGNRAGALELADVHAALLRETFGAEPAPEVTSFAERLRSAPSVAGATFEVPPAPPAPTVGAEPKTAGEAVKYEVEGETAGASPDPGRPRSSALPRRPTRRLGPLARWALPVLAIGAVVLSIAIWLGRPAAPVPEGSIAVLPFASLGPEEGSDFFSDGVTEEIIAHLATVPDLRVISRTSVMRYRGSDRPLSRIADELGVAHVLEGSVRQIEGSVRIATQLIDAETGYHVWSSTYDGDLADIFGLQEQIAREVMRALEPRLTAHGDVAPARRGTRDPEALEMFLRGRHHWILRTREGHARALDYFERAIERDSTYADAYAGLAYTHLTSYQLDYTSAPKDEVHAEIRWAAERAMALDESSADSHVALAVALWWERNWPGAEREFLRALELNPGHTTARTWYTMLLGGWGRLDEALRHIRRAYDVDPFAVVTSANLADVLYLLRRYDQAVEQWRTTLDLGVRWKWGPGALGLAHAQAGDIEPALRVLRQGLDDDPDSPVTPAALAYALAMAGEREEAVVVLERAKASGSYPFHVGRAYVALDEPDSAFTWLRRSAWEWPHRANRFDPALDPLRDDPRFEAMSAQVERDLGIR